MKETISHRLLSPHSTYLPQFYELKIKKFLKISRICIFIPFLLLANHCAGVLSLFAAPPVHHRGLMRSSRPSQLALMSARCALTFRSCCFLLPSIHSNPTTSQCWDFVSGNSAIEPQQQLSQLIIRRHACCSLTSRRAPNWRLKAPVCFENPSCQVCNKLG